MIREMKKLIFAFAILALTAGCEKEEEGPKLLGSWRSVRQDYKVEVDGPKDIQYKREKVTTIVVTDEESYKLAIYEDGTGRGSSVRQDGNGRFDFFFEWNCLFAPAGTVFHYENEGHEGVFVDEEGGYSSVSWNVEEYSGNRMVLFRQMYVEVDGNLNDGPVSWSETHTYRYTFERVE